jgi:hypothetical protein
VHREPALYRARVQGRADVNGYRAVAGPRRQYQRGRQSSARIAEARPGARPTAGSNAWDRRTAGLSCPATEQPFDLIRVELPALFQLGRDKLHERPASATGPAGGRALCQRADVGRSDLDRNLAAEHPHQQSHALCAAPQCDRAGHVGERAGLDPHLGAGIEAPLILIVDG